MKKSGKRTGVVLNKSSKFSKRHEISKNPKTKISQKKKIGSKDPKVQDLKVEKRTTVVSSQLLSPIEQRKFFLDQFESSNAIKISSLELESIKGAFFFPN